MSAQNQFLLEDYVDSKVCAVCNDGRLFTGILTGLDQATNLILSNCEERVFDSEEGCFKVPYGVYMLRGDNVAIVGEINEDIDDTIELENIRAEPLKPVIHWAGYSSQGLLQQGEDDMREEGGKKRRIRASPWISDHHCE